MNLSPTDAATQYARSILGPVNYGDTNYPLYLATVGAYQAGYNQAADDRDGNR